MRNNKSTTISIRFTEEEKEMLNHVSFMKCIPISDVIREGLKLYFNDSSAFETGTEKRSESMEDIIFNNEYSNVTKEEQLQNFFSAFDSDRVEELVEQGSWT